jgi:methionyl-tRNA synthetase
MKSPVAMKSCKPREHIGVCTKHLKFVTAKYDGVVPAAGETDELEHSLVAELTQHLANLKSHQDEQSLRKAGSGLIFALLTISGCEQY